MKPYILHHNDDDGFGAAYAAWQHYGDDCHYIEVNYGQPVPQMEEGAPVRMLDFSYSRPQIEEIIKKHPNLVIIDHHKTAQENLRGLPQARFDMKRSGAILAWEYFRGTPPPPLLLHIQDLDLWKFKLPGTKEILAALATYPKDFKTWDSLMNKTEQLHQEGVPVLRHIEVLAKRMCKESVVKHNIGKVKITMPVANASVYYVQVCHQLMEDYPDHPCVATYFNRRDGRQQWTVCTREGSEWDAGDLCRKLGTHSGGGHMHVGGFIVDIGEII